MTAALPKIASQLTKADEVALFERYIEPHPQWGGRADARLREYGVPVWALIGHAKAINGGAARVAEDYDLPLEPVEVAFAFYRRFNAIIDDRLLANEL